MISANEKQKKHAGEYRMVNKVALAGLTALSLVTMAAEADAQQYRWPRWYLGLTGSMGFVSDADVSGAVNGTASFDGPGWGAAASIGYLAPLDGAFFRNMRFEFETAYRDNPVDKIAGVVGQGRYKSTSYMVNAFYDYDLDRKWITYFGAGLGMAQVELGRNTVLGNTSGKDTNIAWQGLLGLGYRPDSMPLTEWTFGYRYFGVSGPEYSTPTGKVEMDAYNSHNLEAGVKFRF